MDLGANRTTIRPWAGEGLYTVIAWLRNRLSQDPGQLGLFEMVVAVPELHAPRDMHVPASTRRITDDLLAPPPPAAVPVVPLDSDAFLVTLRAHGLRGVERIVFTRNRRTMVSLSGGVLRVHEGFVSAPNHVQAAIAIFATSRNKGKRSAARDIIVAYPVPSRPPTRRPALQHAEDEPMAARLTLLHAQLNLEHFGNALEALDIQVSRRLARRLGHYTPRAHNGGCGEIVISRRHVRRDGWPEAIHTLLHEMVHQWQDETGRPVDHGAGFRAKCRAVGIEPAATRMLVAR